MSNARVGSGSGVGFWLALAAMVAAAAFGGVQLSKTLEARDRLAEIGARHDLALAWKVDTRVNLTRTLAIAKSGNLQSLADYLKPQMQETSARITEHQKKLLSVPNDDALKQHMAIVSEKRSAYLSMRNSIFAQMTSGDVRGGIARIESGLIPTVSGYMDAIVAVEQGLLEEERAAAPLLESNAWAMRTWIAVVAVAVLAAVILAVIAVRRNRA